MMDDESNCVVPGHVSDPRRQKSLQVVHTNTGVDLKIVAVVVHKGNPRKKEVALMSFGCLPQTDSIQSIGFELFRLSIGLLNDLKVMPQHRVIEFAAVNFRGIFDRRGHNYLMIQYMKTISLNLLLPFSGLFFCTNDDRQFDDSMLWCPQRVLVCRRLYTGCQICKISTCEMIKTCSSYYALCKRKLINQI